MAPVNHSQEPVPFVGKSATLQRIPTHVVAGGTQLVQLGQLTLPQRSFRRVELWAGTNARGRPRRAAAEDLHDVALPPPCLLDGCLGNASQHFLRTQWRSRPRHQFQCRINHQLRERHHNLLADSVNQSS